MPLASKSQCLKRFLIYPIPFRILNLLPWLSLIPYGMPLLLRCSSLYIYAVAYGLLPGSLCWLLDLDNLLCFFLSSRIFPLFIKPAVFAADPCCYDLVFDHVHIWTGWQCEYCSVSNLCCVCMSLLFLLNSYLILQIVLAKYFYEFIPAATLAFKSSLSDPFQRTVNLSVFMHRYF